MNNDTQLTAFSGALIRWSEDTWAWKDHTPAPMIKDAKPSWYYNFRVQSGMVEVPVKLAQTEDELAWVRNYPTGLSNDHKGMAVIHSDGRRTSRSQTGRAIPEVHLVPVADWDEWDAQTVIGPKWDKADEPAILAKASLLS